MTSKCDREAVEQVAHDQDAYKQIEGYQQERPHKGAGQDMHYMTSTDKKTSAQAAPVFSSSVTGVSLPARSFFISSVMISVTTPSAAASPASVNFSSSVLLAAAISASPPSSSSC